MEPVVVVAIIVVVVVVVVVNNSTLGVDIGCFKVVYIVVNKRHVNRYYTNVVVKHIIR